MSNTKDDGLDKLSDIKLMFDDICEKLNMDIGTKETAYNMLNSVSQRFIMEGNPNHWICCAIYSAIHLSTSYTPTVGGSNAVIMGNCISSNKLLRSCEISIHEFFFKMKTWVEMANIPPEIHEQIEEWERTYSITYYLSEHYCKIFTKLFVCLPIEKKNTKYRSGLKCSSRKLYDLCWTLYLCAKNENRSYTVDIITSFHLLICCVDYIYRNVLAENRLDLINNDFQGVPENWNRADFNAEDVKDHCIIDILCRLAGTCLEDTKAMQKTFSQDIIKNFIDTKTLYAEENTLLGVLSNENFDRNWKSLNNAYEQFVLSACQFDERILNQKKDKTRSDGDRMENDQKIKYQTPPTPLTRKDGLPEKKGDYEPVTNATNSVNKLQENIAGIKEPTEFIKKAGEQTIIALNEIVKNMKNVFNRKFSYQAEAPKRFSLAISLYYYLLDKILRDEIKTKPNLTVSTLLEIEALSTILIACCVEIVLNAYGFAGKFPWILDCFSITPFQFCKIIEIVVRQQDAKWATRELIKHLNYVEEICLESLVWKRDSPLWEPLKSCPRPLPKYSEAVNSSQIRRRTYLKPQSPSNSAYETFSSTGAADSARRDLSSSFNDNATNELSTGTVKKQETETDIPKSLLIFLRKFYQLGWIRINDLCNYLEMNDQMVLNKIWTLFEYSITHTELMKDRHLDQILMCAIYIYIKVGDVPKKQFKDVMLFYRKLPRVTSATYRKVLIKSEEENGEQKETYDDIIKFYNSVYIKKMTPYALDFSEKKKSQRDLLLSPHPPEKQNLPRKISNSVYVTSMEKNGIPCSPNDQAFQIGKNHGRFFEEFNEKQRRGKRNLNADLTFEDEKRPKYDPILVHRICGIEKDRQEKRN